MAGKRKRNRSGRADRGDKKRQRTSGSLISQYPIVKQAVLDQYYPRVLSLREYLLSKLPTTSKARRKKLSYVGKKPRLDGKNESEMSDFLDQTLIGVREYKDVSRDERTQQWTSFTQLVDDSAFANLSVAGIFSQSEVRSRKTS